MKLTIKIFLLFCVFFCSFSFLQAQNFQDGTLTVTLDFLNKKSEKDTIYIDVIPSSLIFDFQDRDSIGYCKVEILLGRKRYIVWILEAKGRSIEFPVEVVKWESDRFMIQVRGRGFGFTKHIYILPKQSEEDDN